LPEKKETTQGFHHEANCDFKIVTEFQKCGKELNFISFMQSVMFGENPTQDIADNTVQTLYTAVCGHPFK
jgi:hypothetical protein